MVVPQNKISAWVTEGIVAPLNRILNTEQINVLLLGGGGDEKTSSVVEFEMTWVIY